MSPNRNLNRGDTTRVLPPPPPPPLKGTTSRSDGNAITTVMENSDGALVSSDYISRSQGATQHHHEYFSSSSSSEDEEFLDEEDIISEVSYPSMHAQQHQDIEGMNVGLFSGDDYQNDNDVDFAFHATGVDVEADTRRNVQEALDENRSALWNVVEREQEIIEDSIGKKVNDREEDLSRRNSDPSFPVTLSTGRDIDVDSILNEEEETSLSPSDHDGNGAQISSEHTGEDATLRDSVLKRANKDVLEEILAEQEDEYASSVATSTASSISAVGSSIPGSADAASNSGRRFFSINIEQTDSAPLSEGLSQNHSETLKDQLLLAEDEDNSDDKSSLNITKSRIEDSEKELHILQRIDGADPISSVGTGLEGLTDVVGSVREEEVNNNCALDTDAMTTSQRSPLLSVEDCSDEISVSESCASTDEISDDGHLKERDGNDEICSTGESSLPHSPNTRELFEPSPCVSEQIDVSAMENFFGPKIQEDEALNEFPERILEEDVQGLDDNSANAQTGKQKCVKSKQPPVPRALPSLRTSKSQAAHISKQYDDISSGVLPDALILMRQKIESMSLFDSDMMRLAAGDDDDDLDEDYKESKESLKRSFQQSISAAVLVSLAHKRYERRRLAAMEIEKVVRSLVQQSEFDRVRAILLLLSDDYVRSANEDARKGGVVALAACAIGLKKADESNSDIIECKDLILASVVHSCQDHSQVSQKAFVSKFSVGVNIIGV